MARTLLSGCLALGSFAGVLVLAGSAPGLPPHPGAHPLIWDEPPGTVSLPIPGTDLGDPIATGESHWARVREVTACGPVGQTFRPHRERIFRMDFRAQNSWQSDRDERPALFEIFVWDTDYATTRAAAPLFSTRVDLSLLQGTNSLQSAQDLLTIYPDVSFPDPDGLYYLEFSVPGWDSGEPERIPVSLLSWDADRYPEGELFEDCRGGPQPTRDLWFRFYEEGIDTAGPRPLNPSDPGVFTSPAETPVEASSELYWERLVRWANGRRAGALGSGAQANRVVLPETLFYLECVAGRCVDGRTALEILGDVRQMFLNAVANVPTIGTHTLTNYDEAAVALAMLYLAPGHPLDPVDPGVFSEDDLEKIRDELFVPLMEANRRDPVSASNFPMVWAGIYLLFDLVYGPAPSEWSNYYKAVWTRFRTYFDTEEDSANYNLISFESILLFGAFAPSVPGSDSWYQDIWSDPVFHRLVDRLAAQVTPIGSFAMYGDIGGFTSGNATTLLWLFQEAANRYEEPRFLELARRLIVYQNTRQRTWLAGQAWDDVVETRLPAMVMAYRAAAATPVGLEIPPPPEAPGSVYTLRRFAEEIADTAAGAKPHVFRASADPPSDVPSSLVVNEPNAHTEHYVPERLVLRSPGGSEGLTFIFNLLQGYGHGNREVGALTGYIHRGSHILAGGPFPYGWYHDHPKLGSAGLLQHYRGGSLDYASRGNSVTLPVFQDGSDATVAWAEFDGGDVYGYQVAQRRHFLFVKNRFLLVRDGFTAGPTKPGGIELSIGPVWHAEDVRPEAGSNWFDIYFRRPHDNTTRFANPEQYSLVYFVERPGFEVQGYREGEYLTLKEEGSLDLDPVCAANLEDDVVIGYHVGMGNPECRLAPAFVLWQRFSGTLQESDSRWFDTLLIPHDRTTSPAAVAAQVQPLDVGPDYMVVAVHFPGDETWLVVDNPSRRSLAVTDAPYLISRTVGGGLNYLMTDQASYVALPGSTVVLEPVDLGPTPLVGTP